MSAMCEETRSRLRLTEFGFVFQLGQLLPDLSAIDNVSVLPRASNRRETGSLVVSK